jgi:hypothetical protein
MSHLFVLAQATSVVDAGSIGVPLTSLIGSLGAAGAAVAVTYYFLGFLKDQGGKQDRLFQDFRDYHTESQKKFQEQMDRLTDRQAQAQQAYQEQINRITESHNLTLRDIIVLMKSVEKTVEASSSTIHFLEKMLASLQVAIAAIDGMLQRSPKKKVTDE